MSENGQFALVPKTPAALEKADPGTKRVLSGMVTDALALVKKQQRSKPRIVLVNDDPNALKLMELLISDWFEGVTLLTFQNGADAWQELRREAPDLLITDLMRREDDPLDGWVMIPLLAERRVKYPVVVVSGCSESVAKHCYGKPVSPTLRDLVQQARKTLDITTVLMPFLNDEFGKLLHTKLKM